MSATLDNQYHLRHGPTGIDAWHIVRLIELADPLPIRSVDLSTIRELDEDWWFAHGSRAPTPRRLLQHWEQIQGVDLAYPILLDHEGRLMDGMHRVCKAHLLGMQTLPAKQFDKPIRPDATGLSSDAPQVDGASSDS